MKKNLTELVFILDRSGSMSGLESDTIRGYHGVLEKQTREPGEATITTVLFDDKYELLHDRVPLEGVDPISEKDYYVRGCTALLDAIGRSIAKTENALANTGEAAKPEHVMFVITTDGYENASREYSLKKVRSLIEAHREQGWEFIFLGANIDAIGTATELGIAADCASDYIADEEGCGMAFDAICSAASAVRGGRKLTSRWKASVSADHAARS